MQDCDRTSTVIQKGIKQEPKRSQNWDQNLTLIEPKRNQNGTIMEPEAKLIPKWNQNRDQNLTKIEPKHNLNGSIMESEPKLIPKRKQNGAYSGHTKNNQSCEIE